ncbi:MAG TPA: hypothetical protein VJY83_13335 [Thiopseudomonas sp.]|nr:hypothetical protein [Thiopseudomonas sp.]
MLSNSMTPEHSAFFDWHYEADECIEQLAVLMRYAAPSLTCVAEWVALALETQAVAYYRNDLQAVHKLAHAIATTVLALDLQQLTAAPSLLYAGLRAILCQPQALVDSPDLVALYRMLPEFPTAKTLDVYVMFQCHFGLTHTLSGWQKHFQRYASEHQWLDYNALQLAAGTAFASDRLGAGDALSTQLDQQFADYIVTVNQEPLAADWFPWLAWFFQQHSNTTPQLC